MKSLPNPKPPFYIEAQDPEKRVYMVYSYEKLDWKGAARAAEKFKAARKRKMSKNWANLPMTVVLVVREDGKVESVGLPTQREKDLEEKFQRQQKGVLKRHQNKKK